MYNTHASPSNIVALEGEAARSLWFQLGACRVTVPFSVVVWKEVTEPEDQFPFAVKWS